MKQSVIDESYHFLLFLENCDGMAWNSLMAKISDFYRDSSGGNYFFGKSIVQCFEYVEKRFDVFLTRYCSQEVKYDFRVDRHSVILFCAAEILAGARREFEVGNFF